MIDKKRSLLDFWEDQVKQSHTSSNYFFRKSPSHYHMMLLVMSAYKLNQKLSVEELIKRKANPQKKLVGLELIGKEKANHGDCVHIGRAQVGVITSGCISPTLNKNIALCRIDISHANLDTEVEVGKIDGHQKRISAKIVPFPHYDPKKTRVRS